MTGLFARADHPFGYGYAITGESMGKAHGFVVIAVECADDDELKHVRDKLAFDGFEGTGESRNYGSGWMGEWYGGKFDFVGILDGFRLAPGGFGEERFRSFGDNRYAGIYTAAEVLGGDPRA